MYDVHSGINMSAHVEHGSTYSNCFSGEPLQQGCSSPSSFKMHPHKFGWRFGLDTEQTTLTCGTHQDEDFSHSFNIARCIFRHFHTFLREMHGS